jgi:hypothetical protein
MLLGLVLPYVSVFCSFEFRFVISIIWSYGASAIAIPLMALVFLPLAKRKISRQRVVAKQTIRWSANRQHTPARVTLRQGRAFEPAALAKCRTHAFERYLVNHFYESAGTSDAASLTFGNNRKKLTNINAIRLANACDLL